MVFWRRYHLDWKKDIDWEPDDEPLQWFEQATLATSVRIVVCWRGGVAFTLAEFSKPAEISSGLEWLERVLEASDGCWLWVEKDFALRVKCSIPSSVITRVMGLPCDGPVTISTADSALSVSGAIRAMPTGWPEKWDEESEFEYGRFEWERTCIACSEQLRRLTLVPQNIVTNVTEDEVAGWWEEKMGFEGWSLPQMCLGFWVISEHGCTEWETPLIPFCPRQLGGHRRPSAF